ncbi:hypothetical protein CRYUN_Cryun26dG0075100 [Craigia yunnanensis]
MEVQASSSVNSSCNNNVEASFKKVVSESEVSRKRLFLKKSHVDTIIKPHLTSEQVDILNKGEGSVKLAAVDVRTGDRFKVSLSSSGYGCFLNGAAMIKKMNIQGDDGIEVSWRKGALHILYNVNPAYIDINKEN